MSAEPSDLIRYIDMQLSYLDDVYELESSCYDFPWTRNILKDCVLHEYDFYIALYNKDVVGYIISRITNNESHILNLTVHTDYRNLGIASSLIDMVIRKCNIFPPNKLRLKGFLLLLYKNPQTSCACWGSYLLSKELF